MTRRSESKKTKRKRYSQEFKAEALALAEKVGVPAAAKELGLHESQLYGWRTKMRAERNQSETERAQAAEIARLKRRLAEGEVVSVIAAPRRSMGAEDISDFQGGPCHARGLKRAVATTPVG